MKTVWVEIIKTYTVQAVNGPTYIAGTVHQLPESSAMHLCRKGVARIKNHGALADLLAQAETAGKQTCDESEVKEITTDVDLAKLFDEYRTRAGVGAQAAPEPEPQTPAPEPEPMKRNGSQPLVSCIMPTYNRRAFMRAAIACWELQNYKNKELIIVDDGQQDISDLVPKGRRVRYVKLDEKLTTGQKRNVCCELAKGQLICHFDDDDYSTPDRISDQVRRLTETGKHITGYSMLLFWDTLTGTVKRFSAGQPGYIVGTSFMYTKSLWQQIKFEDKQQFTDNEFLQKIGLNNVAASYECTKMVARIHDAGHTSPKEGIAETVPRETIPPLFWDNELLRVAG